MKQLPSIPMPGRSTFGRWIVAAGLAFAAFGIADAAQAQDRGHHRGPPPRVWAHRGPPGYWYHRPGYYSGYYYGGPPVVVAPPPPVYYAPPPPMVYGAPGLNVVIPIR